MLFDDAKKENKILICDSCKKDFPSSKVKLKLASDNVRILSPMMCFLYVDKDGKIMGGSAQPSAEKGDRLLCCPHCNQPHLFGFSLK